jgi:hypothetical protein
MPSRLLRDTRLVMIWTGPNKVMDLIIHHEYCEELLAEEVDERDIASEAPQAQQVDEKVYE